MVHQDFNPIKNNNRNEIIKEFDQINSTGDSSDEDDMILDDDIFLEDEIFDYDEFVDGEDTDDDVDDEDSWITVSTMDWDTFVQSLPQFVSQLDEQELIQPEIDDDFGISLLFEGTSADSDDVMTTESGNVPSNAVQATNLQSSNLQSSAFHCVNVQSSHLESSNVQSSINRSSDVQSTAVRSSNVQSSSNQAGDVQSQQDEKSEGII